MNEKIGLDEFIDMTSLNTVLEESVEASQAIHTSPDKTDEKRNHIENIDKIWAVFFVGKSRERIEERDEWGCAMNVVFHQLVDSYWNRPEEMRV